MLAEEGEDLAPAIHRLLGSVKRPVPIPDAVAGSAVKLVGLAVLLQRSLITFIEVSADREIAVMRKPTGRLSVELAPAREVVDKHHAWKEARPDGLAT
jgi:hypothetical protein